MKKLFLFITIGILLTSFISAIPITGSGTVDDDGELDAVSGNTATASGGSGANKIQNQETKQTKVQRGELSQDRVRQVVKAENRLRVAEQTSECPANCTCTGSVTKCSLADGTREMTIRAGKSGNTIVQVKEADMSTKVELYKDEGKIYGIFKGNKTREVKIMPDQIREKIREKVKVELEEQEVELEEDGEYEVQARKRARLFGLIPVRERVRVEIDSQTGEITRTRTSWWGFLARDTKEEPLVGESCGTVTPGQNDACCQNKGYDYWNSEKDECLFNEDTSQ